MPQPHHIHNICIRSSYRFSFRFQPNPPPTLSHFPRSFAFALASSLFVSFFKLLLPRFLPFRSISSFSINRKMSSDTNHTTDAVSSSVSSSSSSSVAVPSLASGGKPADGQKQNWKQNPKPKQNQHQHQHQHQR